MVEASFIGDVSMRYLSYMACFLVNGVDWDSDGIQELGAGRMGFNFIYECFDFLLRPTVLLFHNGLQFFPDRDQTQFALADILAEMAVETEEDLLGGSPGDRSPVQHLLEKKELSFGGDQFGPFR